MSKTGMRRAIATTVIGLLAPVAIALAQVAPWPAPTQDEMLASIRKGMDATYLSENGRSIWGNTGITVALSEPKIGRITSRQLHYGKPAQPAWPVRVAATVTVTSSKRATEVKVWGGGPSDVWLFHKNDFDEWVYKIGKE